MKWEYKHKNEKIFDLDYLRNVQVGNCCTQKKIKVYNKNKGTTCNLRKRVWSFKLFKQQDYGKFNEWNRTYKTPGTGLVLEEKKEQ